MKKAFTIILLVTLSCWSCGALLAAEEKTKKESDVEATVTPGVTYVDVSGNKAKFREDTWMKDGLSGGIENFKLHQQFGKDGYFNAEGRAIYNQRDYDVRLELVKPDVGFLRAGFSQYPKYFDNTGGYYAPFLNATNLPATKSPFASPSFSLGNYPQMDVGRIYFDAGLTLPNLPKIEFGYEHQYKDGTKNLLEWGSVYGGLPAGAPYPGGAAAVQKKIYPAYKDIDERVDIFKLGVDHTIGPISLGDNFYFEKYSNDTARSDDSGYYLVDGSVKTITVNEQYHHDLFSNTFHMDHEVNDKIYWSVGHLFTSMSGDSGYNMQTFPDPRPTTQAGNTTTSGWSGAQFWNIPSIGLQQDSQVGNFNVMVGPFAGLTGYAGVQVESTETEASAFGNWQQTSGTRVMTNDIRSITTALTKNGVEETIGLRYTKIPYTTLYSDAKWGQQTYCQDAREVAVNGAANTFKWGIDTDVQQQQYTAGFSTSPWSRVNLTGQYRKQRTDNVFTTRNASGNMSAYNAWIHDQEFTSDEISAKLAYRICSRVSVALKYQMISSDIYNTTNGAAPTNSVQSCDYFANIYSLSTTWTPMNRLYLTGAVSYQDTTTTAFDNGINAVRPYKGNVYTVNGTAGYAIDQKTDLTADYTYSHTDNFVDNGSGNRAGTDYGLPYYLFSNEQHGLNLRLTRRIKENVSVGLRYGFYKYNESYSGGMNDYTAHLASVNCTIRF